MGKKSNLIHEIKMNLKQETKYGVSKHQDKIIARQQEVYKQVRGIYSTNTYTTYAKACENFINYCLQNYKNIHNIDDCRAHISDYLQNNEDRGLSAWTIHMRASAIASMYHTTKDTFEYRCPERSRANIIRSRNITNDTINNVKHERIKEFCRATGARRIGLTRLTINDIRERKNGGYEIHLREKNGYERWARIDPEKENFVKSIFEKSKGISVNGELRLFNKNEISKNIELHSCRADYAIKMYQVYAHEGYANGNIYNCRKDKLGLSYDKGILKQVSENLGHHRIDVVVNNYLYK